MEPLLETIELDIEESNELLFKVKVEGVEQAPAKVRLVCEVEDLAYMFSGHPTSEEGVVQFLLPVLKDRLKAGTYLSRVEVLIENRYFAPVQFNLNLKKAVTVVAESIQAPQRRPVPQVTVTAAPIVVKKAAPVVAPVTASRPLVVEEPKKVVPVQGPPTAKPSTLKERYRTRAEDPASEKLIHELAQAFIKAKKK